ncbi:MAG: MFS transporter [Gemmatimonadota bacterium]|nr:MFS transporter [Gemmatimonadota bacterium]
MNRIDKKSVASWAMYDFANSAFTTLVVTFIYSTYFVKSLAPDEIAGTTLWSRGVTFSAIAVALVSPLAGAVADRGGFRKGFLLLSTIVAVVATTGLYTALPGQVLKALLWFAVANFAFEMGNVFYNAFLPDIAPREYIGRISGYGWGLGYIGGLLAMAVAMVGFVSPETPWFGFTKEAGANIRATNLLVAAWFAVFSIPIFLWVKQKKIRASRMRGVLTSSYRQLVRTFREAGQYREILKLLIARLFYNDGLITIFSFGGIYAAGTFGFSFTEIMVFGIVLNVAAGIGAFAMGFLDDLLGGKRTIQVSLVFLILATLMAVFTHDKNVFWISGIMAGFFAGPNQSASRSLLGRFVPPEKENEFFGLFAFSGKATAFLGPLVLGELTRTFQSQRVGISIVAVLFVTGGVILKWVDEKEGIRAGGRESLNRAAPPTR